MKALLAVVFFFALAHSAEASATIIGPVPSAPTCNDRCAQAGLVKSKCDWICDGKVIQTVTNDDDDAIALSCYEKCRDEGTSHNFCRSSCRVPATNKIVQKSCYERCRKDSTHNFCEHTCR